MGILFQMASIAYIPVEHTFGYGLMVEAIIPPVPGRENIMWEQWERMVIIHIIITMKW